MKNLFFLSLLLLVYGCGPGGSLLVDELESQSYATVDLSTDTPTTYQASGSGSFNELTLTSQDGAVYRDTFKTWALQSTNGDGLSFTLDVDRPGMIQLVVNAAAATVDGTPNAPFNISVGGKLVNAAPISDSDDNFHEVIYQIPGDMFVKGDNDIKIYLDGTATTELFVKSAKFIPQKVFSSNGTLSTTLYAQFSETNQVSGVQTPNNDIWTRGYGLEETTEMIPGPTLYFNPGDLVSVDLVNLLNPEENEVLGEYENIMDSTVNTDEILGNDSLKGELNIPHNLNNTNLHVHGLHVDPSKDDVTIVIVPAGVDTSGYDAPHSHSPVSSLDSLNEYSVSDQGVKPGEWDYQYKIPDIHLPGTHWYHPHKHGATSAQVENGMAGTMVIQENSSNAIVPYPGTASSVVGGGTQSNYDLETWQDYHDRVLAIQEITNFGVQAGQGNGLGSIATTIDVTVNGSDSLVLNLQPNQLERWRIVNAGTNHRAFSHIWLGKDTGVKDKQGNKKYVSVDMYLVAVDGITLPEMDKVTAENPALMAPGNRSDFLVQLEEEGNYVLFKNYNVSQGMTLQQSETDTTTIYSTSQSNPTFWPAIANTKNNPYLLANKGTTQSNYGGFIKTWNGKTKMPVLPLIGVENNDGFLELNFSTVSDFNKNTGKWQPGKTGAGAISDAELMYINVQGDAVASGDTPAMPSNSYLSNISPTTMTDPPSYVSPVTDADVLQSRPVVFDASGIDVNVTDNTTGNNNNVNQFTLNGRFFVLDDPIGNPKADSLLAIGRTSPDEIEYSVDQDNIPQTLSFGTATSAKWNTNKVGDKFYFPNPGYYQSFSSSSGNYTYSGTGTPSWSQLTGLADVDGVPQPTVVNTSATKYAGNESNVLDLPIAQTGEEWVLINNSDVSHPFHIHINPFFVEEVGQLSYEYTDDTQTSQDWFMRAVTAPSLTQRPDKPSTGAVPGTIYNTTMNADAIVGNWWDTIIIPAHGYVKVRYWFNVPNQTDVDNAIQVMDNYNKTGIWVYHCHILRHEDRGMMMPVITKKNAIDDED